MSLTIIAAISENNVIGFNGKIPWNIPEDIRRFKKLTIGYPVVMGRKTYDSIIEKFGNPLPQRMNIVMTKGHLDDDRISVVNGMDEVLSIGQKLDCEFFVIGGSEIYREALPYSNKMELTRVHKVCEGDIFFPKTNWDEWEMISREPHLLFSFETYVRK